jgi:hypothetical protein
MMNQQTSNIVQKAPLNRFSANESKLFNNLDDKTACALAKTVE